MAVACREHYWVRRWDCVCVRVRLTFLSGPLPFILHFLCPCWVSFIGSENVQLARVSTNHHRLSYRIYRSLTNTITNPALLLTPLTTSLTSLCSYRLHKKGQFTTCRSTVWKRVLDAIGVQAQENFTIKQPSTLLPKWVLCLSHWLLLILWSLSLAP